MNFVELGLEALACMSPVLMAVLTWASVKLAQFIKAKVDNERLEGILLRLDDAIMTVVRDVEMTVVKEIKAANADGVITAEEKASIKRVAIATLKEYLGLQGLTLLAKVLGFSGLEDERVDNFLYSKIEAAVHDMKERFPAERVVAIQEQTEDSALISARKMVAKTQCSPEKPSFLLERDVVGEAKKNVEMEER